MATFTDNFTDRCSLSGPCPLIIVLCCRVDSYIQTASYPEFAFARGLVDEQGRQWLRQQWTDCLASTEEKEVTPDQSCQANAVSRTLSLSIRDCSSIPPIRRKTRQEAGPLTLPLCPSCALSLSCIARDGG